MKQINLHPDSPFFPICQRIMREHLNNYMPEKYEKTVKVNNAGKDTGLYKFIVEWQDKIQSTVEIFKLSE